MKIKNLVIAAHPDDEVIGCGGTIRKLIQKGEEVFILFLAEGVTARYNLDQIKSKKAKDEIILREKNALKANSVLGIKKNKIIFLKNICCRMDEVSLIEHTKVIEKYINLIKPNRIITHNGTDLNTDHKTTFKACMVATRPKNINKFLSEIWCFEILSSTNHNLVELFKPNLFVNITDQIQSKTLALSKYQKEVSKDSGRDKDSILALAKYRGIQSNMKYAEAFQQIKKFFN
tara:strand:+ start:833 stop:1528 length:696 start_codon:yes stop_codon:yes gene_type:complete